MKWVKLPKNQFAKLIKRVNTLNDQTSRFQKVLGGVTVAGISFLDSPVDFIIGVIVNWIVTQVLTAAGAVANLIRGGWEALAGLIVGILEATLGRTGTLIASLVSSGITELDRIIDGLVSSLGPFAFVGAVIVWAVVIFVGVQVLRISITVATGAIR